MHSSHCLVDSYTFTISILACQIPFPTFRGTFALAEQTVYTRLSAPPTLIIADSLGTRLTMQCSCNWLYTITWLESLTTSDLIKTKLSRTVATMNRRYVGHFNHTKVTTRAYNTASTHEPLATYHITQKFLSIQLMRTFAWSNLSPSNHCCPVNAQYRQSSCAYCSMDLRHL